MIMPILRKFLRRLSDGFEISIRAVAPLRHEEMLQPIHLDHVQEVLAAFHGAPVAKRWDLPFPMGVFGTLRQGFVNSWLMRRGRIAAHRAAFLPHFAAQGIQLFFRLDASAPFEIYFYEPRHWKKIIRRVDELEDFQPERSSNDGYHRSLAWLHLLPEDYSHPAYHKEMLAEERDLKIDPKLWPGFERIPCWIYSSISENQKAAELRDCPIIWDGVGHRETS